MSIIKKIVFYTARNGRRPFAEWLEDLDTGVKSIIMARLARVRLGNFGDCKVIKDGGGVSELRIDYGSGYRIYFGKKGAEIVILLMGGDKKSQNRDIEKAKKYWLTCKEVTYE